MNNINKAYTRLKKWRRTRVRSVGGKLLFDDEFKELIIEYHYETGQTLNHLAQEFEIPVQTLMYWKNQLGDKRTGIYIGARVMNDVRTRCLAVEEILEHGLKPKDIYQKYGVKSPVTVARWVERYKNVYGFMIASLPDGVPWIAHDEKLAIGSVYDREVATLFEEE